MKFNRIDMAENNNKAFDDVFYPLTEMFEGVNESNYLQYAQNQVLLIRRCDNGG